MQAIEHARAEAFPSWAFIGNHQKATKQTEWPGYPLLRHAEPGVKEHGDAGDQAGEGKRRLVPCVEKLRRRRLIGHREDECSVTRELNLGCDGNDILAAMLARVEQLLFSDDPLPAGMPDDIKEAIRLERPRARLEDRHNVPDGLRMGFETQRPGIQKALADGQAAWQRFLDSMRVFSVSEVKDDILMWAHYAEYHRGAVLALRPLPGMRAALREAVPIRYTRDIPVMASAEQWANHLLGTAPIDFPTFFHAFAFSKSEHWRYEREWRCRILDADPKRDVPGMPLVWACPLLPDEVVAIYLGCRIEPANRTALLDVVRSHFPAAEVFEAAKSRTRFALEFSRLR